MTKLLVITNVWNEKESVDGIVENLNQQTLRPTLWVWIDDGSMNGTRRKIIESKTDIPMQVHVMPSKMKGNLDTIGLAYNEVMPNLKGLDFDYMTLADVDNIYPLDYYEFMCKHMDEHPEVGVLSAQSRGELGKLRHVYEPMGGGKIVRWEIVEHIDTYWDLAPDSFLNIKARAQGYETISLLDYFIDALPTSMFSAAGRFRFGRRLYYVSRHLFLVLYQALLFALKRDSASEFLRGYWQEWGKGTWKCQDEDVKYSYSLKRRLKTFTIRTFLTNLRRLIL